MDVVNKIKSYEDSDPEINLYKQAIREVVRMEKKLGSFSGFVRGFAMDTLHRETVTNEAILMKCVYGNNFSFDSDGTMIPSNEPYDGLYNLHVLLVSKNKIQNFGNPVTEYLFFNAPFSKERYPRNRNSVLGTPQKVKANFQKNFMSLENFKKRIDSNFKNPVHSLRAGLPIHHHHPHLGRTLPPPTTAPVSATITQDATTLASAASPPLAATRPTTANAAASPRVHTQDDIVRRLNAPPTTATAAASPRVHTQDDIVRLLNTPPPLAPASFRAARRPPPAPPASILNAHYSAKLRSRPEMAPPSHTALQNTPVRGGKRRPTKRRRATKRRKQTKRKQTKRRR